MKKKTGKYVVVIILFVVILAVPAIIYWITGEKFVKTVKIEKQKISELYEGKFRENALPYLSEKLMPQWYKKALEEEAKKRAEEEKKRKEAEKKAQEEKEAEEMIDPILRGIPTIPEGQPYLAPTIQGDVIIGRDGWLFINQVDSVNYYLGNCILSEWEMNDWRNSFQRLYDLLQTKGIKLAIVTGPNKEQVYPEKMPSYQINNLYKRQLMFEKYMHENSNVPYYYPIRELAAVKSMFDTYYVADTHWNEAGGLIVTEKIYEAFGMPLNQKDIRGYTEPTKKGDVGWVTGNTFEYTDYKVEYKKDITTEESVWNENWDIDYNGKMITSSNKNGKKLMIIGDSFRVAPMNIMKKDFEISEIIHQNLLLNYDYTSLDKVRNLKEGDCLLLVCVERFDYLLRDVANIVYDQLAY